MEIGKRWWDHPVLVARFDMRYERRGDDECWPWMATRSSKGYGMISISATKRAYASRLALERKLGEPLGQRWALHSCDNPPCVNPAHLRAGDIRDNNRDKAERGRGRTCYQKGERNKAAKLNAEQVAEIRALAAKGDLRQWQIAARFGVSQATVSEIKNGRIWQNDGKEMRGKA